jgi:hypothetical protein
MRLLVPRRSLRNFVPALELNGPVLGTSAEGDAQRRLLGNLGFLWRYSRRFGAIASACCGSRSSRGRRERTLERTEVCDLPHRDFI